MSELEPREFEHLVYDLLVRKGLLNPSWRTPGADRGRDIEGDHPRSDLSGQMNLERWYIECKRYSNAIDWPTVRDKLAYAENHQADYLLLCTTSTLSPQCKDEVATRARRRQRPSIRAWEGPDLERLLAHDDLLIRKYSLASAARAGPSRTEELLWLVSKAVQTSHGGRVLAGESDLPLEFAAAVSELASSVATHPNERSGRSFQVERDGYPWCAISSGFQLYGWDPCALRALLSAIRFMADSEELSIRPWQSTPNSADVISIDPAPTSVTPALRDALNSICVMGDLEWTSGDGHFQVRLRRNDGSQA